MINMFYADIALAAELIAMGMGFAILLWAYRNQGTGTEIAKFVGAIIFTIALFIAIFTTYNTYKLSACMKGFHPMKPQMQMQKKQIKEKMQKKMIQRKKRNKTLTNT